MKTILLATGNDRKLQHCHDACLVFNINVQQLKVHIDEIQSPDAETIATHKANAAYALSNNRPVIINDSFWRIPALRGFPGGYMKDVQSWLQPADWLRLMEGITDRRICVTETLVYKDATQTKVFSKDLWLQIVTGPPRGKGDAISQVVEDMHHHRTIAEYHEKGEAVVPVIDFVWGDFGRWYTNQPDL
jgi:inosine/xanthosine triphosphate pyrophosphatase family protein